MIPDPRHDSKTCLWSMNWRAPALRLLPRNRRYCRPGTVDVSIPRRFPATAPPEPSFPSLTIKKETFIFFAGPAKMSYDHERAKKMSVPF